MDVVTDRQKAQITIIKHMWSLKKEFQEIWLSLDIRRSAHFWKEGGGIPLLPISSEPLYL